MTTLCFMVAYVSLLAYQGHSSHLAFTFSFISRAVNFNRRLSMTQSSNNSSSFLAPLSFNRMDEPKITTGFIPIGPDNEEENRSTKSVAPLDQFGKTPSADSYRYFEIVNNIPPQDLMKKFAESAPKNVQEAVKSTVVSILGTLPTYALDAGLITTSSKLASLLYQMQITGYMFKNAEYRMSLTRSLKGLPKLPTQVLINKGNNTLSPLEKGIRMSGSDVQVRSESGEMLPLNPDEVVSALQKEVDDLRAELMLIRNEREKDLRTNLLTYVQALPERELASLTSDISDDVLQSIQMMVQSLMSRMGVTTNGPEVVIQQNMGAVAQICVWQMVVGYKLRELEAFDRGAEL